MSLFPETDCLYFSSLSSFHRELDHNFSGVLSRKRYFNLICFKMATNSLDQGPEQILSADSFININIDGSVKLRMDDSTDLGQSKPISVPGLLQKAAEIVPNVDALAVKREEKWIKWTYKEYLQGNDEVRYFRLFINCILF